MRINIIFCLLYLLSCVPVTITLPDKTNTNTLHNNPEDISLWVDGRPCISEKQKNEYDSSSCYYLHDPVCGCDGQRYGNPCFALKNGVLFFLDKEICNE